MNDLVFVIFDDEEGGGYNAVEGTYSLMVSSTSKQGLKEEIKKAVEDYFGDQFTGKVILREFKDESFDLS